MKGSQRKLRWWYVLVYQVTAVCTMDSIINKQYVQEPSVHSYRGITSKRAVLQVLSSPLHMVGILTSGMLGRLWYVLLDVVTIFWPLAKISSQNQCHIPDTCLSIHSPEGCCIAPKDQEVDNPKISTECNTLLGTCSVGSLEVLIVPVWESNDVKLVHTVSMQMCCSRHTVMSLNADV